MLMSFSFFFNDPATTEIYTLSLHDALPILLRPPRRERPAEGPVGRSRPCGALPPARRVRPPYAARPGRSEEHTSELQSLRHLVCRLLLEKKKKNNKQK